jgi:Ca2+-binding RTX toxin-like protein
VTVIGNDAGTLSIAEHTSLTSLTTVDTWSYDLEDSADNLLTNSSGAPVAGADSVTVIGNDAGTLSIAEHTSLTSLTTVDTWSYDLEDTLSALTGASAGVRNGATTYTVRDSFTNIRDALQVAGTNSILNDADAIEITGTLTIAQAATLYTLIQSDGLVLANVEYHVQDSGSAMESASTSQLNIDTLQAASSVTAVAGGATQRIDLSSYSGDQEVAFTITGNTLNNQLTGGGGNDSIAGQGADDTITGGLGNDTLTGGSGNDTFVFGTILESNNLDTLMDFGAGDMIDFQFGLLGELTQGALRGTGTIFESIETNAGGAATVDINAGMIVRTVTGESFELTEQGAGQILNSLTGFNDLDQFYLAFENADGDTGIFRIADTVSGGGWSANQIELMVVLDEYSAANLTDAMFVDFTGLPG